MFVNVQVSEKLVVLDILIKIIGFYFTIKIITLY